MTVQAHGAIVTYSRKVFIPLTKLCRDVCHYCTFAQTPKAVERPYLTRDEVLAIARAGAEAGCREARSEEHTSELQSLMRISYAVFCLKTKKHTSKPTKVYSQELR